MNANHVEGIDGHIVLAVVAQPVVEGHPVPICHRTVLAQRGRHRVLVMAIGHNTSTWYKGNDTWRTIMKQVEMLPAA